MKPVRRTLQGFHTHSHKDYHHTRKENWTEIYRGKITSIVNIHRLPFFAIIF